MTDTHKPLPTEKVKELEEYINKLIWAFGIASTREIKDKATGARFAKGACEVVQNKLQSLINEDSNEYKSYVNGLYAEQPAKESK